MINSLTLQKYSFQINVGSNLLTYIVPEKIVLQGSSWFQPDPLLRVLVGQEKAVLAGLAQALDFGQPLADLGTCFQSRSLNKNKIWNEEIWFKETS